MNQKLLSLFLAVHLVLPSALPDAADEYEAFVDKMIPLSYELAERAAYYQESKVFTDRLSQAQSHINRASKSVQELAHLLPELGLTGGPFCPRFSDGRVDIAETLRQLFLASQIVNFLSQLEYHLPFYRKISDERSTACADDAFNTYSLDMLSAKVPHAPSVEVMDNTYIEFTLSGGAAGTLLTGYWSLNVIGFGITVYQIFTNIKQQERIRKTQARLERERANDTHYRQYAKEACQKIRELGHASFGDLDKVAAGLENALPDLPKASFEKRKLGLMDCLSRFEKQFTAFVEEGAKKTELAALDVETEGLRTRVQTNQKIIVGMKRLERLNCENGFALADEIKTDLSMLQAFSTDKHTLRLIPEKMGQIHKWEAQCAL